ncbi:uncharacterized protein At5g19025-like [Magnolia sinica]|uniref:uncharacterized protein At5g19025-like n=1 Tax=Magnolia sinica TaxID=86752 RepID=UPI00265B476F|nr:uncharacterized protein At5g19025-like [Magnolia sinica]
MVDYRGLISSRKYFNNHTNMTHPFTSTDEFTHLKQPNQVHKNRKLPPSSSPLKIPLCAQSQSAAVDIVILVVVLGACGVLVFPYVKLFYHGIVEVGGVTLSVVKEEVGQAPIVYMVLGLGFLFAFIFVWGIFLCMDRKCDRPNCRGLRNAAEFDIQLETEECVKNSSSPVAKVDVVKGLFELAKAHHKELEAEIRNMAPPNGRAILIFRGRCGCSVGRMEVWGPKKLRKMKK